MSFCTEVTPFTPRAIATALSIAAWFALFACNSRGEPLAMITPKTHLFLNSTFANQARQHSAQVALTQPYAARYFEVVDQIWATRDRMSAFLPPPSMMVTPRPAPLMVIESRRSRSPLAARSSPPTPVRT